MENLTHTLTIENKKRITATGIDGVRDLATSQFTLIYPGGKISVGGEDMKIVAFSKQTGAFSATGVISSVRYSSAGEGIRKKLLK